MKELVQELAKALELQVRARARLRLTLAALHRTRTARAPQEIKYVNPANEKGADAKKDFEKWQRKVKGMTPPKSRSMRKTVAQRRRLIRHPARPASARTSSGRPPASASLGQLVGRSWPYRPCFPHRSRFKGQMINYAYTDEKKIRKHLLGHRNYHQSKEDGLEFLVAVRCFGYAGGVVSVWVYYGMLDKPDDDD